MVTVLQASGFGLREEASNPNPEARSQKPEAALGNLYRLYRRFPHKKQDNFPISLVFCIEVTSAECRTQSV